MFSTKRSMLYKKHYIRVSNTDYMVMVNKRKASTSVGSRSRPRFTTMSSNFPDSRIIQLLRLTGFVGNPVELERGRRKRNVLKGTISKHFLYPTEENENTADTNIATTQKEEEEEAAKKEKEQRIRETYEALVNLFILTPHDCNRNSCLYKIQVVKSLVNQMASEENGGNVLSEDIRNTFLFLSDKRIINNPPETYTLSKGYLTKVERARLLLTIGGCCSTPSTSSSLAAVDDE